MLQSATKQADKIFIRWLKKHDGTVCFLADFPQSHPKLHTEEEIILVKNMLKVNIYVSLAVFWVELSQQGYTGFVWVLYLLLRRIDGKTIKLTNPK